MLPNSRNIIVLSVHFNGLESLDFIINRVDQAIGIRSSVEIVLFQGYIQFDLESIGRVVLNQFTRLLFKGIIELDIIKVLVQIELLEDDAVFDIRFFFIRVED